MHFEQIETEARVSAVAVDEYVCDRAVDTLRHAIVAAALATDTDELDALYVRLRAMRGRMYHAGMASRWKSTRRFRAVGRAEACVMWHALAMRARLAGRIADALEHERRADEAFDAIGHYWPK